MFSLLASHSKSEKPNEAGRSSGNTSWATEDSPPEYTIGDQQPITFYFDNDDMKSNIIYSPEMQPLYELYEEPPKAFGGRPPVHIYRLTPSPPGAGSQFEKTEIMFIRWNHIGRNSQITFVGGETVDLKDMFQRIQGFAQRSTRKVMSPIGELEWRHESTPLVPMLYDLRGGLVAMYKTNKKTWIFGRDKGRSELHVARPAVEFLDLIILGWVVTTRDIDTGRNS